MPKNSMFLPVAMVVVIVLVIGVVGLTERTNAPSLVGDSNYPYQICTFSRYCDDNVCTEDPKSIIAYFEHEKGAPRLEIPGMAPEATIEEFEDRVVFNSTGGDLKGSLTIFRNRTIDFVAVEGDTLSAVEHFASGRCDRPVTP